MVNESVGGAFQMDSADWSNGIRYHVFDTRSDSEFKMEKVMIVQALLYGPAMSNESCPLSVVLEPKRPRNCISFGTASRSTAKAGPAKRLTIFEHVDGCCVCANLFGGAPLL
jgi:hypothetical protein